LADISELQLNHLGLKHTKNKILSIARIDLHTGEFNSSTEWKKETATNLNLIPRYEGGESISIQLEKNRRFIDSLLQNGQTPRSASQKLVEQGMQYLNDKKPKKAMSIMNLAYLVDSTNANVYWGFGKVSSSFSDSHNVSEDPTPWYDIALSLDSNNVNLLRSYADYKHDQFSLMKSYRYNPKKNKRASELHKEKRSLKFKKAESIYLKAIALAPDHLITINGLASLYKSDDRIKDAEKWYLKALAIHEEDLNTLHNLVRMYLDENDCENARAYYYRGKMLPDFCVRGCPSGEMKKKCGDI